MLPPDVRAKMENQINRGVVGGIGGKAHENAASASARNRAMGSVEESSAAEDELEAHPETTKEPALQACPRCRTETPETHNFCSRCGTDLMRGDFAARLGIKFSDADVEDYLFRGLVVREIKIFGNHTITVKSSQPSDSQDVDQHIMQGKWRKSIDGSMRDVSEFLLREQQTLALAASIIMMIDGKSIGDSVAQRIEYLSERGSAFVDLASKKAIWFNRALTNYLQKADAFEGS